MTAEKYPQVGLRALANLTGLHRDQIRGAIGRANLKPSGKAGGHPVFDLREALHALFARRGDADAALLSPVERRALADARLRELELQRKRGEVVLREDVRQASSRAFSLVANACRSIPDSLERQCGLNPDMAEHVENVINEILNQLADDMEAVVRQAAQLEAAANGGN